MSNQYVTDLWKTRIQNSANPQEEIKKYRKLVFLHGLTELGMGCFYVFFASNITYGDSTNQHYLNQLIPYLKSLGMGLGIYCAFEGFTDMIFRQRKHHLLSNIFEFFGIHALSVPKVSELERLIQE